MFEDLWVDWTRSDLTTTTISVDVSDLVPFPGTFTLNGWVRAPSVLTKAAPILLCCLAGGKCSTGYFDLQVEGYPDYSMADYLAARGFMVVAFDHLGVGTSSPVDDIFLVTPRLVGAINDYAHRTVAGELVSGTLVPSLPPLPKPGDHRRGALDGWHAARGSASPTRLVRRGCNTWPRGRPSHCPDRS